ncbi:MAG: M48 family metallopeptidase [Proteobacteria bacterium]|nr:M48 family metallopeptidase [Pseudomonadota bacterium]
MTDAAPPPQAAVRWAGRFHDGRTATGHAVDVALGTAGLEIRSGDGAVLGEWPYAALATIEPLRDGEPAVLARDLDDDARLRLTQPCDFAALIERAPQLRPRRVARTGRAVARAALWLGVTAAASALLWFGWPKVADGLAMLVPASDEDRIGAQARAELQGRGRICDVAAAQETLELLIARLAVAMNYDKPVTVTVIDLPIVNAVAIPGNQIMVFQRLLTEAQSPEELSAVLAHELGHVAARHPTRNLMRQFGLNLVIMTLSGNSSWDSIAQLLLSTAYTREFEAEADALALRTLADASIGGQGWIDFFNRHAGPGGRFDRATAYLSTHPPSAERRDQASRLPPTGSPVMSAGDWLVLRSICRP